MIAGKRRTLVNNKRGLVFKNAFFALVAFSMIIIAVGSTMGGWGSKYNSGINYDLEEYNSLNTLSGEAQTQKDKITPQDPDPSTGDFEGKLFRGGYGILGRIFLPFSVTFNLLESLESRFGLPPYIGEGILTLIVFALTFAIIAIIFRLPRTSS